MRNESNPTAAPLITVVMPVYNTPEDYLTRSVESIRAQTFPSWELLLIDDGSTMDMTPLYEKFSASDPRIRVILAEHGGVSAARNLGIRAAAGQWLTFVDSDDTLTGDALEILWNNRCGVNAVIAGYDIAPNGRRFAPAEEHRIIPSLREDPKTWIDLNGRYVLASLFSIFLKKEVLRVPFREGISYGEDGLFINENLPHCGGVCLIPDCVYHYWRHDSAGSLHNGSIANRLKISYELTAAVFRAFDNTEPIVRHFAGKFMIRCYNDLVRQSARARRDGTAKETVLSSIREKLAGAAFSDPRIRSAAVPLREIAPLWEAVLHSDPEEVLTIAEAADGKTFMSDSPGLISVILPFYNAEKTLETAVNSIRKQLWRHWELILVDDGSTDNSPALADRFAEQDSRIRSLHIPHRGVSAARNAGMKRAEGEWLCFIDADDSYTQDAFTVLINTAREAEEADLVMGAAEFVPGGRILSASEGNCVITDFTDEEAVRRFWHGYGFAVIWNKLYRRSLLNTEFDTSQCYGEDTVFNFRQFRAFRRIAVTDTVTYRYTFEGTKFREAMIDGLTAYLKAVFDCYPNSEIIQRCAFVSYAQQVRTYVVSVLDQPDLSAEKKAELLQRCRGMIRLPKELNHEEYLYEKNRRWWHMLLEGKFEETAAEYKALLQERRARGA